MALGLEIAQMNSCNISRRMDGTAIDLASWASATGLRHNLEANQIKYKPPMILSAVMYVTEAANTVAKPSDANRIKIANAHKRPVPAKVAVRKPKRVVLLSNRTLLGPGAKLSAKHAGRKNRNAARVIINPKKSIPAFWGKMLMNEFGGSHSKFDPKSKASMREWNIAHE